MNKPRFDWNQLLEADPVEDQKQIDAALEFAYSLGGITRDQVSASIEEMVQAGDLTERIASKIYDQLYPEE